VIPLFEGGRAALDDAISRIVTDSRLPGEPKDPDSNSLMVIYEAFSTPEEAKAFRQSLIDGLGWGDAKKQLADKIDAEIGPMRDRYASLMAHPEVIEEILLKGAQKARTYAQELMEKLRYAMGLRSFDSMPAVKTASPTEEKKTLPVFKQYREADGLFYFKLTHKNADLLVSKGYQSGAEAGKIVKSLKADPEFLDQIEVNYEHGVSPQAVKNLLALFSEE
jgi:tryptophanyl-tRNA synthetase